MKRETKTKAQSRTVRGWVVVSRWGWPDDTTFRLLRRDAVAAYPRANYDHDRRKYGVQVVRCTITTEPQP